MAGTAYSFEQKFSRGFQRHLVKTGLRFMRETGSHINPEDPAFTEETPFAPNSPYAASKAGSDHLVRSYQHTFKLPTLKSCDFAPPVPESPGAAQSFPSGPIRMLPPL